MEKSRKVEEQNRLREWRRQNHKEAKKKKLLKQINPKKIVV
jgi:hypothetical protein